MLIPAERHAATDRSDDAGDTEHFAGDISDPPGEYRRGDHQIVVVEIRKQLHDEEADCTADCDAAQREDREAGDSVPGTEGARQRRGDGEAKQHEAGGVVQQALAF